MKKDTIELIVIIDESGSMGNVKSDTIGGFNSFLETHQKLGGDAKLTLVKFDTKYSIVNNGTPVQDVLKLDNDTYSPGGMTALLDAVGKTIDEVGKRLSATEEDERPEKVMVMIITDGEENSSREYTIENVRNKIKEQQDKYKCEFVFLGADQDAWSNASSMGMHKSVNFSQSDMGNTLKKMSHYSSSYRTRGVADMKSYDMSNEEIDKDITSMVNDSAKDLDKNLETT